MKTIKCDFCGKVIDTWNTITFYRPNPTGSSGPTYDACNNCFNKVSQTVELLIKINP